MAPCPWTSTCVDPSPPQAAPPDRLSIRDMCVRLEHMAAVCAFLPRLLWHSTHGSDLRTDLHSSPLCPVAGHSAVGASPPYATQADRRACVAPGSRHARIRISDRRGPRRQHSFGYVHKGMNDACVAPSPASHRHVSERRHATPEAAPTRSDQCRRCPYSQTLGVAACGWL